MAIKGSGRFRNRKLGFKSRINVLVGVVEFDEDPLDGEIEFEEQKEGKTVETGVDKEEEGEVHLQAVIAASNSSVSRNAVGGSNGNGSSTKAAAKAFIPTPDSAGTIDQATFDALYPKGYIDPITYIRFSDTVEDATTGAVEYTMDEDDEDWLEAYNAAAGSKSIPAATTSTSAPPPEESPVNGRRKGKGDKVKGDKVKEEKEDAATGPISEDDFEAIMEHLEKVTDQKAPMAHVDTNLLPAFVDIESSFTDPIKPELAALRGFARLVYPHWKDRRLKRSGKSIIPQLDYDESNEYNPYVCFRRRELKTSRKTRRSDAQNVERLIRLRNDLYAAHALMLKTREREQLKLEAIQLERRVFDSRCETRELKRRLGEADGDEDLLVGRREKKRKKEDGPAVGSLRLSLRKPDPSNYSASSLITPVEDLKLRKERAAAINQRMERDAQKKRENDQLWEDWTDGAYVTRLPPTPARYWRSVEPINGSMALNGPNGKLEAVGFATQYQPAVGRVRSSFRRRIGRGGRVMLDRIAPSTGRGARAAATAQFDQSDNDSDASDEDAEEEARTFARRQERFRYDSDAHLDFTSVDEPTLIDDFELKHLLKRAGLLRPLDVESLTLDCSYLEEAYRWTAQDLDRHVPPPVVFGRPPPRPPLPSQVGPGGVPLQVPDGSSAAATAAAYGQAQMAAAQALRLAQQQALKRQEQAQQQQAGQHAGDMRRTPSQGSPGVNGQPVQAHWTGAEAAAAVQQAKANGLVLPPGFPNHLQSQLPDGLHLPQQHLPNGLVASLPNGANGLPATSGLSAPPFSNLQMALQQQQQAQQQQQQQLQLPHQPLSSPLPHAVQQLHQNGRPLSSNSNHVVVNGGGGPSRPNSAQSSHHSPNLLAQALPSPARPNSAAAVKQQQMRGSPYPMQAGIKSPLNGQNGGGGQQIPFGGFVTG